MPTGPQGESRPAAAAMVTSGAEEYEPEMVDRLLRLEVQAPEAKFNNVVDMMDWLDRD
jgi:hypothetical protein